MHGAWVAPQRYLPGAAGHLEEEAAGRRGSQELSQHRQDGLLVPSSPQVWWEKTGRDRTECQLLLTWAGGTS